MKRILKIALVLMMALSLVACNASNDEPVNTDVNMKSYSLVQNVYGWGSSYSKIIVPVSFGADKDYVNPADYVVSVERLDKNGNSIGSGNRYVEAAYRSNAEGKNDDKGAYVTLDLAVSANLPIAQPYYNDPDALGGTLKAWATCNYTVTNKATGDSWNELDTVYHPDEAKFETAVFEAEKNIPYAYYEIADDGNKHPLVIWLHGAGSGGTDIGFVTGGMHVTKFVDEGIQEIFGGAHILLPQAETVWMDGVTSEEFDTMGHNFYTESLMALIEDYVKNHENVDPNRIYVGGCSNGGYMTVELARMYPDYFAAIFPICEAMMDFWVTDDDINVMKDIPTWFVHCVNDPVVDISMTADATYNRLVEAGAENIHFTRLETINDPDYGNAYGGHFSWIYSLRNLCSTDYNGEEVVVDGNPVSLYQWLAAQSK